MTVQPNPRRTPAPAGRKSRKPSTPVPKAPAAPPAPQLVVKGGTDRGKVRDLNEDYFLTPDMLKEPPPPAVRQQRGELVIVADGMGGHAAGEVAAQMTAEEVMRGYYASQAEPKTALREAILSTNAEIFHTQQQSSAHEGMGSTLVAALFLPTGKLVVANVGDSRLYRLRAGELKRLTVDHTWVNEKLRAREITPQEAANHPYRSVITRAMGSALNVVPEITDHHDLKPGDVYLLCSDGLSNMVPEEELRQQLALGASAPKPTVDRLIKMANDSGGPDNITAVIATYGPPAAATVIGPVRLSGSPAIWGLLAGAAAVVVLIAALIFAGALGGAKPTPAVHPTTTITITPTAGTITSTVPLTGTATVELTATRRTSEATATFKPTAAATKPTGKPAQTPTAPPSTTLAAPVLVGPVDNWSAPLEAVTFQWQSVPGAATYRVETRSDRQGQTKWQSWGPTTGTSLIVRYSDHGDYFSIPGTVYYWRVVALDTAGRPGHYSAERRFIFRRMETPVPPTKTPKPPPTDTPEPPPTDTPEPPPPTNTPVPPTTMPGA